MACLQQAGKLLRRTSRRNASALTKNKAIAYQELLLYLIKPGRRHRCHAGAGNLPDATDAMQWQETCKTPQMPCSGRKPGTRHRCHAVAGNLADATDAMQWQETWQTPQIPCRGRNIFYLKNLAIYIYISKDTLFIIIIGEYRIVLPNRQVSFLLCAISSLTTPIIEGG